MAVAGYGLAPGPPISSSKFYRVDVGEADLQPWVEVHEMPLCTRTSICDSTPILPLSLCFFCRAVTMSPLPEVRAAL